MWQDTISNSVVWLRYPSSGPPVVFFLIFFSASIIPSGYLMIPQVKANRVWDGYSGEAKVCFNVFFHCKLERSHCLIKPECCFFIPNQHVPSRCFSIRRSSFILERLSFLVFQDLLCWIHAFIWNCTAKNISSFGVFALWLIVIVVFQAQVKPKKEVSLLDLDDCESNSLTKWENKICIWFVMSDFCLN